MKSPLPLTHIFTFAALFSGIAAATPAQPAPQAPLHYQTGDISILGGQATLKTGTNLRFLDAADARRVITDLWGNPPTAAEDVQGMIVPAGAAVDSREGWGVVLTESHDGHVSDSDAAKLDYTKMMQDMQAAARDDNDERSKAGYGTVDLIGWADTPRYDSATHKMYWAKELAFHDKDIPDGEHTLNYAVRVLGRDNVMELNAVAGMEQLPQVRQGMQTVLSQVSFNPTHRYEDFNSGTDKLATYGLAGLLGVVAAKKIGLLALGAVFLKKAGVLLVAAFGALGRLFRRRAA